MYVFNRIRTANAVDLPAARLLAPKIAAAASKVTGRPITAFETQFGHPGGISWSTIVKDMADLAEMSAKLASDPAIQALVTQGLPLWGLAEDHLIFIVASSISSSENSYYASTSALPAPGKIADAIAYGIKVQEHVTKAGFAGMFGSSVFGPFGEVGWLLGADSSGGLDAFQDFQHTDAGLASLIGEAGPLFVPGSSINRLVTKLV
jgi:hypothetical protein